MEQIKTSFDFEKPITELMQQIEKVKQVADKTKVDMSATLVELEEKLNATQNSLYHNLTGWQEVQLSRHPERPQTLDYISLICDDFIEMHGDRTVGDDKAIIGGFATIGGQTVMVIGHQKGKNTKERQYRNFGMANPEGYRKALRLMRLAVLIRVSKLKSAGRERQLPGTCWRCLFLKFQFFVLSLVKVLRVVH
jgi:acetyl-CoA carboxylase carboxyl transferase subunit alpha